jgi:hypothetical protein
MMVRDVSLGRLFDRAFGVMGHNPLVLLGASLLSSPFRR